jgi:hypothetical protein
MKKKLKVAVQIFGHLRTYDKCSKSLKKYLLDNYDCDVFMHTWSERDHCTQTWYENKMKPTAVCASDVQKEFSRNFFKLNRLVVEKQEPKDLGNIKDGRYSTAQRSIFGISAMFHSMAQANRLREEYAAENNAAYDFIVCIRPDILLVKNFAIEPLLENLTEEDINNGFFTMGNLNKLARGFEDITGVDLFFFARPVVISGILNRTDKIMEKFKRDMTNYYSSEQLFIQTIKELGYTPWVMPIWRSGVLIVRETPLKEWWRQFIRTAWDKDRIRIYILQILKYNIFRFQFNLLGKLHIDICLGNHFSERII